ncbi:ATPase, AAA family protein [Rhodopirellula maiorica SM1]|uniref:ATPase, AAA family protein n=2 Tax=Novipirellula TaxID=2795426 RepID=M5RRT3_9BACT|nr:ATPase, AAA family protein [Rhodopirellula maiorica SM1]
MFNFDHWQTVNETYLSRSLDWLRSRLQQLAEADDVSSPPEPQALASGLSDSNTDLDSDYQPALEVLAGRFQLSEFEKQVLLLSAAMEFDTRIAGLCVAAQGDAAKPYPTASLCFSLFDDGAWDLLSPERPLRHSHLIEIDRHPQVALTASPIRIDDRIASYIKGLNFIDERLSLLVSPLNQHDDNDLPPSQQAQVEQVLNSLQRAGETGHRYPIVQLLGPNDADKRSIAGELARHLGLRLYQLTADLIPHSIDDVDTFVRLWQRECQLVPMGLFLSIGDDGEKNTERSAMRLLERLSGIVVVDARDRLPDTRAPSLRVDVSKPSADEQLQSWADLLPDSISDVAGQLVGQFDLTLSAISEIADAVSDIAEYTSDVISGQLWNACRQCTRPKLEELAQRIDVKSSWDDIVLADDALELLHQVAAQVRHRGKVLDQWGFRDKVNRGLGVTALFAGESGTGKTMAAEVIAHDLDLDLYRIDLSSVINKYIGETEKNLRRLFDAAESGGAILFFDEADALFGKRSEVKDSHDRFANVQVNYLLQRMESYRGLAILATNNKQSLDPAFTRRLRFIIDFNFPEAAERKQIWHRVFPESTPLSGLDYNHLAKLRLTGGNIYNIALNAAFAAASDLPSIDMPTILAASKSEMIKSQKPLNASDFRWANLEVATR